jgi:hypothetical protein
MLRPSGIEGTSTPTTLYVTCPKPDGSRKMGDARSTRIAHSYLVDYHYIPYFPCQIK